MVTTTAPVGSRAAPAMTGEERKVIFASSLGTVFEWYDFYIYGTLAPIIAKWFFSGLDPTAAFIFTLLVFAAGFLVRPFGALVFGRLGDMSPERRGGLRSHRGEGGRTYEQLYAEAAKKNIKGRSTMNKAQLERAVGR